MTVITVTTVGYREVYPLSRAGEAFTVLLLIGGVGTALYTFTLLATVVVEGGLHLRLEQRRIRRMIDQLHDHFIVCGYGRIGSVIAEEFRREGTPFVVVERDPERVHAVIAPAMLAVEADASREEVLQRLGIERARGLIAAVGTDAENVYAILTARVLAPHLFIVARAETDDAERKLLRAGAAACSRPTRSAPCRWRRPRSAPPSSTSCSWPRAPAAWSSPWSRSGSHRAPSWRIGRLWMPTFGSASA